tara:strand:+ start:98 stop:742 length:645 start_codon:yes stop_codon:yes gene_type:complete
MSRIESQVENLRKHWKNTKEYGTEGYENSPYLKGRELLARKIVDTKPKSVLELGVFGGYNSRLIHELDSSIELTGFDINEQALKYAKEKLPVLNTVHGSLYDLGDFFKKNSFDVVISAGVLIHIPCWDMDTKKADTTYIKKLGSDIANIAKKYVFHAEHHDGKGYSKYSKPSGVADGGIRYIQDFNDLYSEYSVEIEDAPNGSNGFNQIIKVTL